MWTKTIVMVAGALMMAGCASPLQQQAKRVSDVGADSCQQRVYPGESNYVVEGFGGGGEQQLIVTERRPVSRCIKASPSRGATMAAVE